MPTEYLLDANPRRPLEEFTEDMWTALDTVEEAEGGFLETDYRETPTQRVVTYADDDGSLQVKLWTDSETGQRYFELNSETDAQMRSLHGALAAKIDFVDHDALVSELRGTVPNAEALAQLAYSAPMTFRQDTFDLVSAALRAEASETRHRAAFAIGVLGWAQFREPVMESLNAESDPDTRAELEKAQNMLTR